MRHQKLKEKFEGRVSLKDPLADINDDTIAQTFTCKIHGDFDVKYTSMIRSTRGCRFCALEDRNRKRGKTRDFFVERAREVHGDNYDYSKLHEYPMANEESTIVCDVHGSFSQRLVDHILNSHGCPGCVENTKAIVPVMNDAECVYTAMKQQEWISLCRIVHDDKFDYSLVDTSTMSWHVKMKIICPKHGEFEQLLGSHLNGIGCSKCGHERGANVRTRPFQESVEIAKLVHDGQYTYPEVEGNVANYERIEVVCPEHGTFTTTFNQHIDSKVGCPQCSTNQRIQKEIEKYNRVHHKQRTMSDDTYSKIQSIDWLVERNDTDRKSVLEIAAELNVDVNCIHDRFKQHGVRPKRYKGYSLGEREVGEYVESLGFDIIRNDCEILDGSELDIVIPSLKIAIEYNGLYWHSNIFKHRNAHRDKLKLTNAAGYRLISLNEDEWKLKRELVELKLKELLGVSNSSTIFARKCSVVSVSNKDRKSFLDTHHIQGNGPGSLTYGLEHCGKLVAVMTLIKKTDGLWILNRYASSHNVPGGFSKLLKHFERNNNWKTIETFADLRWSEGKLYKKDFNLDSIVNPDYAYIINNVTVHKFNFRHSKLQTFLGEDYNPELSETENMAASGYNWIFNCGLNKYIRRNHELTTIM